MSDRIYIDRREDGKYRVMREGARLPSALSDTRLAAVALAREMRPTAIFVWRRRTGDGGWRPVALI